MCSDPVATDLVGALLAVRILAFFVSNEENNKLAININHAFMKFNEIFFLDIFCRYLINSLRAQRGNPEGRHRILRDYPLSRLSPVRPIRACK